MGSGSREGLGRKGGEGRRASSESEQGEALLVGGEEEEEDRPSSLYDGGGRGARDGEEEGEGDRSAQMSTLAKIWASPVRSRRSVSSEKPSGLVEEENVRREGRGLSGVEDKGGREDADEWKVGEMREVEVGKGGGEDGRSRREDPAAGSPRSVLGIRRLNLAAEGLSNAVGRSVMPCPSYAQERCVHMCTNTRIYACGVCVCIYVPVNMYTCSTRMCLFVYARMCICLLACARKCTVACCIVPS